MTLTTDAASPVTAPTPAGPTPPLPPPSADKPRNVTARTIDDRLSLLGSFVASFAIVWLGYLQLFPFEGKLGFFICWWAMFLLVYGIVTAQGNPRPVVVDRLMSAAIAGGTFLVFLALAFILFYTVHRGWPALIHTNFYTQDGSHAGPSAGFTKGGIYHAIIGSLIEIGIASSIALPLGIGTAVYMTEIGGRLARIIRVVVESMTALPDLLAGLFIYTVVVLYTHQKNGFAAALALTIMMLPIIARSSDVVLRVVPGGLREASLALGASQWRTVWSVVLPTARSGLATALILGIARAIGETAPVLITSGESTITEYNPLGHQMNSLPLYILQTKQSGTENFVTRGFGAATVLVLLVVLLFTLTRIVARNRASSR